MEDGGLIKKATMFALKLNRQIKQGKRVIPVLTGNAQMPRPEDLPPEIRELVFRQASQVRPDPDFHNDIKRLMLALEDNTRAIREPPPSPMALPHQAAAMPLHFLIVLIFGLLALISIGGGIFAIARDSESDTQLKILSAELSTGHVGVALVGIGFIITFFTIRAVLKSQRDLAALPLDGTHNKAVNPSGGSDVF